MQGKRPALQRVGRPEEGGEGRVRGQGLSSLRLVGSARGQRDHQSFPERHVPTLDALSQIRILDPG